MRVKRSIPKEKVKTANARMIARCSACDERLKLGEQYLDEDFLGWNGIVHVKCWLAYAAKLKPKERG